MFYDTECLCSMTRSACDLCHGVLVIYDTECLCSMTRSACDL